MSLTPILALLLSALPDIPRELPPSEKELVVVAFIGSECPLARLYAPRLSEVNQLADVAVIGVNPNGGDSPADVERFRRQYHAEFPIVKDVGHRLGDYFGATRQLEIFLLDRDRAVRYHGRVDDQYGPGQHRPAPLRQDLLAAIDELKSGQPVSVPETPILGCSIERAPAAVAGGVTYGGATYGGAVAEIFERRCVECHRPGQIGPFSLTSYREAAAWSSTIRSRVADGTMPPWHADPACGQFANDRRLPDDEKQLLLAWIDAGAAEGEPVAPRAQRQVAPRWSIGQPDKIVTMPVPLAVPATGIVDYITLEIDLGLTEDRWVRATEIAPGERSLVHHAQAVIGPPGKAEEIQSGRGEFWHFADFAPGLAPSVLPDGMARRAPAGWHLYLTMHYVTTGLADSDQTSVGMIFTDTATDAVYTHNIVTDQFTIPPGEPHLRVEQCWTVPQDILVLALFPHMHLRGKSFSYEALYPNGRSEFLLKIPSYDFMWQQRYVLKQPKRLPAGTIVRAVAVYDNSADNPANPDPTATVKYGRQSSDEMFNGYVDFAIIRPARPHVEWAALTVGCLWLARRRWKSKRTGARAPLNSEPPH
ncbi:MAG TPA: redoxin domain-containing protein [Pirellulales bacterium]|jgi:mono/diheme cytochrome c family protein|nr:redoxin domain-containing protein [Pirellulales bacterium]